MIAVVADAQQFKFDRQGFGDEHRQLQLQPVAPRPVSRDAQLEGHVVIGVATTERNESGGESVLAREIEDVDRLPRRGHAAFA